MLKFLQKVFGSKNQKDVELLLPLVDQINEEFAKLSSLSDDELRGKTLEFKARIAEAIGEIEAEITELRTKLKEDLPHEERHDTLTRVAELEKERDGETRVVLDEILPEA